MTVTPSIPLPNKSLGEEDDLAVRIFIDGVGGSAPPNSYSTIQLRQQSRNQNQPQRAQSNFLADYANNRKKN
ncbi:hypothetical protein [Caldithrix abyssi]